MKKVCVRIIVLSFIIVVSTAHSIPFDPPVVTIKGYTGHRLNSDCEITFDLGGRDCDVYLAIYTKDMGPMIPRQTNGSERFGLGMDYHTFGGVDTCIVVTPGEAFTVGTGRTIVWDGKDKLGNEIPGNDFIYYLIANDAENDPILFGENFGGWYGTPRQDQYETSITPQTSHMQHNVQYYQNGIKLNRPRVWWYTSYWELGQDTGTGTWWAYEQPEGISMNASTQIDTDNADIIWFTGWDSEKETPYIGKALLNPDGPAEMVASFGENGRFNYQGGSRASYSGGCEISGMVVAGGYDHEGGTYSTIYVVDKEIGEEVRRFDASAWFVTPQEAIDKGARTSEGPGFCVPASHDPYRVVTCQWHTCMRIAFNPFEDEDWLIWANGNGDYFCDRGYPGCLNYNPAMAWVCNDNRMGKLNVNVHTDRYNFCLYDNHGGGPESMEVIGPDGYGICWLRQKDQLPLNNRWWSFVVDNDTAYDGVYTVHTTGAKDDPQARYGLPVWNGYDIFKGIIVQNLSVDREKPRAYTLTNAPDPFNPVTTITYGIVNAGHVTLDIYNVTGQKVATIHGGHRDTGTHTIRWDASGFSSGIYFAVMRTGGFTLTEKMMLVR